MLAIRFSNYDHENSSDHALVDTAEFVMNSRKHQICWMCTDPDSVFLPPETDPLHVSKFPFLLYSQPVGLGLLVELLTSGADVLSNARDFAFDAFEVLPLLH